MRRSTMRADGYFARYLPALEREMRSTVRSADALAAGSFGMLHHHLGWADVSFKPSCAQMGKRVRPALCLLSCEASGGNWQQALPAAAAIELLHGFSLIHDDIEDRDEIRRGRLAVWAVWGEAHGPAP